MKLTARKVTWIGLLVSQAVVLHILERLLPVPQLAPGVKLGLANIATLVALHVLPWQEAFLVVILRILLGSFLGGGVTSFLFSFSGGVLSYLVMSGLLYYGRSCFSLPAISVAAAFTHNAGQLFMAALVVETFNIYVYFPVLAVSALFTGFFIGATSALVLNRLTHTPLLHALPAPSPALFFTRSPFSGPQ